MKKVITTASEKFLTNYLNNASPTGFESEGQKLWLSYIKPHIDEYFTDHYGTVVGVIKGSNQTDIVPSIASRVKHRLGIKNPYCVPYDLIFGCPGWVQGVIQAHMFIKAGEIKRCLVVGAEVLSRVVDPFDRDTIQ